MYGVIRIFVGSVLLVVLLALIKRCKTLKKRKWNIISAVFVLLIVCLSYSVPIENCFFTFSTPEESFRYTNFGNSKVELVVDGQNTDFVVAKKNEGTYLTSIIPKTDDGWKLGVGFDTKNVKSLFVKGVSVSIYKYKSTDEYYVAVLDTNGGKSEIRDSCGSEFFSVSTDNIKTEKTYYHYYAYVTDYNDYLITVNGLEFQF